MAGRSRAGFTLVEILVVIVIVGMLAALLLPAIMMAREGARRTRCGNNQKEIATALQTYETAHRQLPGYVNRIGNIDSVGMRNYPVNQLTWVEVLFEQLDRADLAAQVRKPVTSAAAQNARVATFELNAAAQPGIELPLLICTSDVSGGDPLEDACALSYAVNCGLSDASADYPQQGYTKPAGSLRPGEPTTFDLTLSGQRSPAYGLFFDQSGRNGGSTLAVRSDRVRDGAGQTIMMAENVQAVQWLPTRPVAATGPLQPRAVTQVDVGLLWWPDHQDFEGRLGVNAVSSHFANVGESSLPPSYDPTTSYTLLHRFYARPSSNHGGGATATYADGHQQFVEEGIAYHVYQELMSPDTVTAARNGLMAAPTTTR